MGRPPKHPQMYLIDSESGCWIWQRALAGRGYGTLWDGARMVYAHRWFYEREHGALAEGLQLHHLCSNERCVNPEHLEPVTPAEHHQRHILAACRRGHPMDEANSYVTPGGQRQCRACKRVRGALYRERRAA